MALSSQCPKNKTEVNEASTRIGCGVDAYGNSQYMCIPNEKKSSLVEFCFNGVMGIEEKGNCLENSNGKISRYNCSSFTSGCPNTAFYKHNIYEYPACLQINTENRCYVMDPSCPSQVPNTGESDDTENLIYIHTMILLCSTIINVIMIIICLRRLRTKCKRNRTLRKELLASKENRSLNNDDGISAYSCTNGSLHIGTLSISRKEGNEIHYEATATKDNNEVEIIFCAPSELKKEDIILVDKLEGPAVYKFISKGQQKTSEQSSSRKKFIAHNELKNRHILLTEEWT